MTLFKAAADGGVDIIEALASNGINLDVYDETGKNSLHIAASNGRTKALELLLNYGCDLEGVTDSHHFTPLHFAVSEGHIDAIEALAAFGASMQAKDRRGCTPLHTSIEKGRFHVIEALLRKGASPDLPNSDWWAPLKIEKSHRCYQYSHTKWSLY